MQVLYEKYRTKKTMRQHHLVFIFTFVTMFNIST